MLFSKKKNEELLFENKLNNLNNNLAEYILTEELDYNVDLISKLFENVDTYTTRKIINENDSKLKYVLIYCEGLVNNEVINESIIKPLVLSRNKRTKKYFLDTVQNEIIQIGSMKKTNSVKEIIEKITYGDTLLIIDGYNEALLLNTPKFNLRSVSEPENEKILLGPREGFTESILFNISMLHRKLRTNDLKIIYKTLGKRSNTKIAICYMKSIVKKEILQDLNERLDKINIDGILDSNYIIELIKDNKLSPFRTIGTTERPDVVVGKMLEGRIALLIDGTPVALTLPYLFVENFQSSEDYYLGFYYTSFSRIIRALGFIITCTIPALYIAIVAFHHEMIPTSLFLNITMERQSVPLPASLEAFVMLLVFEILRETGVRMPTGVGQALSIVGALVIGQAAVEAKLVAAPMIIIVGITGITSLLIPKMNAANIIVRFTNLLLSSIFGLFGFLISSCYWLIHIINLKSFNVNQVDFLEKGWKTKFNDNIIRMPWPKLRKRDYDIANQKNLIRNNSNVGDENA
ncbi:MAG: spore germination protein [Bacilli bacterium]|nr:spore germination protein [Bacilli bacterium]